jgi:hypothetical protein
MGDVPGLSGVAGTLHDALIADQLAEERARKTSLEQRALAVITTSGVLVTLLIGLAAFVKQASTMAHVGDMSRRLIVAAAGGFIAAAVLALMVVSPRKYNEADLSALDARIMRERWSSPDLIEEARKNAVLSYYIVLHARNQNGSKATLLFLAVIAEVAAVLAAGIAAAITVMGP